MLPGCPLRSATRRTGAVVRAISGQARAFPVPMRNAALPRLWPKNAEGSRDGNFPPSGGSQHRICLDAGFRRRPAKRKSRAEARTHFRTEERRNDEQRYHIQHPDRVQ